MTPVERLAAQVIPLLRDGSTATLDEIGQKCLDLADQNEDQACGILMLARGMLDDELREQDVCSCCGR